MYFKLMFDLMTRPFQADITRVITFSTWITKPACAPTPTRASPKGFHPLASHHGNNPEKMDKLVKIQNYHTQVFAGFIKKIGATKEGNGTVLDRARFLLQQRYEQQRSPQQRSAAVGDPGTRQRENQRRPAPEVSWKDSRHGELLS